METRTRTTDAVTDSRTGAAGRRWEVVRLLLGIVYLLGGLAHVALGVLVPEVYVQFANQALVGVYTDLWTTLVVPYLTVLQPLVALFEVALGVALLWRGRAVRVGHAAGAVFQAGLVLSGPWGPVNAVLALLHVAALRYAYPGSVVDVVRRRDATRR
jgi:hypothetical protein